MWQPEEDSIHADFVQKAEHNLRANQWISETAPKRVKANDETHPLRLHRNRKMEDARLKKTVLRKREGSGFQAYVNARHRGMAYDTATCMPHTWRRGEGVVQTHEEKSESSSAESQPDDHDHHDLMAEFAQFFGKARCAAPVGTRTPVRDSLIGYRETFAKKRQARIEGRRGSRDIERQTTPQDDSFSLARPDRDNRARWTRTTTGGILKGGSGSFYSVFGQSSPDSSSSSSDDD